MSHIEDVARLKELEAKASPATWVVSKIDRPDAVLLKEMRNAATYLLSVAGQFRAGDAVILELFVEFMEHYRPDGHLNDEGPGKDITNAQATDCLRRMLAAARIMGGEE